MGVDLTAGFLAALDDYIGLAGPRAPTLELDDRNLSQIVEVSRVAAVSKALGANQGFFYSILRVSRTASAGETAVAMDPYDPGTVVNTSGFPPRGVPLVFDIWSLRHSPRAVAVTDFNKLAIRAAFASNQQAMSEGQVGARSAIIGPIFDVADITFASMPVCSNALSGQTQVVDIRRWPRGTSLELAIETSGVGTSTVDLISEWWVGPRGHRPPIVP